MQNKQQPTQLEVTAMSINLMNPYNKDNDISAAKWILLKDSKFNWHIHNTNTGVSLISKHEQAWS